MTAPEHCSESDTAVCSRKNGASGRLQKFGFRRLYTTELMVIVQLVRWYEIGLLKPYELDVPHPAVLMTDLRRRVAMSPKEYVASSELLRSLGRMMAWWSENTVTTAWRSVKTHVRVADPPDHLCDTVADFLWELRDVLVAATGQNTESKEVQR